jgi:hypothetical protein
MHNFSVCDYKTYSKIINYMLTLGYFLLIVYYIRAVVTVTVTYYTLHIHAMLI